MKISRKTLNKIIQEEINECGMMPPLPPMPPGPPMAPGSSPCAMAAAPAAAGMPPEGSDDATAANEIADLVADIVYNVLISMTGQQDEGPDSRIDAGIDSVLGEGRKASKKKGDRPYRKKLK